MNDFTGGSPLQAELEKKKIRLTQGDPGQNS